MQVYSKGERWFDVVNYTLLATLAFVCFYPFVMMTVLSDQRRHGQHARRHHVLAAEIHARELPGHSGERGHPAGVHHHRAQDGCRHRERCLRHGAGRVRPGGAAPARPQVPHDLHGDPDVLFRRAHSVFPAASRSAPDQHLLGLHHPAAVQHLELHRHEDLLSGDTGQPQGISPARWRQRAGGPVQDSVSGVEAAVRRDLAVRGGRPLERLVRGCLFRHQTAPAAGSNLPHGHHDRGPVGFVQPADRAGRSAVDGTVHHRLFYDHVTVAAHGGGDDRRYTDTAGVSVPAEVLRQRAFSSAL